MSNGLREPLADRAPSSLLAADPHLSAASSAVLDIRDVNVTYGRDERAVEAIRDVSFTVPQGEFLCVVGPSGCGKTTLLKAVAGLLSPTRGSVLVEGTEVSGPPPDLALVFQEYTRSLFPWLSVKKNVTFPL